MMKTATLKQARCNAPEIPVFWKKGAATREWAENRTRTPEEMEQEGQAVDVSLGDIAQAVCEGQLDDQDDSF